MAARPRVAHKAAQQARVRRTDAVVEIDIGARKRTDEYLILFIRRNALREPFVEAVDTLDDENLVRREAHLISLRALAGDKVELGDVDLLTREQRRDLFVDQIQIKRLQRFEVRLPVAVKRRALTVHKIIVKFKRCRLYPRGEQLHAQTARRGRLAGARGSREAEEPHLGARLDPRRGIAEQLRMQRFADHDHVARASLGDLLVDTGHRAYIKVLEPAGVAVYEPEEARGLNKGHRLRRVGECRAGEEDTAAVAAQLKGGGNRRAVSERAAEEIIYAAAVVEDDGIAAGKPEQLFLILVLLRAHHRARHVFREYLAHYRLALRHHTAHLQFKLAA